MDIEHAALAGIVRTPNAVDRDDFRSPAGGRVPELGAVGVAACPPQAIPAAATKMAKYPRTVRLLASTIDSFSIVVSLASVRGPYWTNPSPSQLPVSAWANPRTTACTEARTC